MSKVALLLALCAPALAAGGYRAAGLLSGQGAQVLDSTGGPRQTFSNNETIGFAQTVFNGALSPNRIAFSFAVFAPNGNKTFKQSGNAVPGSVGNAAAAITGVPISGFYQGPGVYTLKAYANLDGVTLEQDQTFTVSSPNLLLIYPPNGATNLTDNPLTFQWFSSGATSYRVTVADNLAMYNPVYQTTVTGVNSMTYPNNPNPSDPRQRLSSGQTYYWKVEGLDVNGNVIASSPVPFSFSVASVSLTRDLAVTDLQAAGPADASGNIPFTVTVKNQGSTTESNIPLKFTLGGLPAPAGPVAMPPLSPADVKTFSVSAPIPADQNSSLAIACITIFDDNNSNNCRTLNVTRPPAVSTGSAFSLSPGSGLQSADQIWQAIQNLLQAQGLDLSQYNLVGMEGTLTRDELMALLDQLRQGTAQYSLTGPPLPPPTPGVSTATTYGLPPPSGGPPQDTAIPPSASEDSNLQSADEIWRTIELQLRLQGIDLSRYQLTGMEGSLTRDELLSLLDQLRQGQATVSLSGPPLAGATAPTAPPQAEGDRPVPVQPTAPGEDVQEWSGYTRPLSARVETLSVTDAARWKRLWRRVSEAPAPDVDFTRSRVIAVLAGRGVRADRVEIVELRPQGPELLVRYKLVAYARLGRPDAPPLEDLGKTHSPYLLKAVPNQYSRVSFELVKENANE